METQIGTMPPILQERRCNALSKSKPFALESFLRAEKKGEISEPLPRGLISFWSQELALSPCVHFRVSSSDNRLVAHPCLRMLPTRGRDTENIAISIIQKDLLLELATGNVCKTGSNCTQLRWDQLKNRLDLLARES